MSESADRALEQLPAEIRTFAGDAVYPRNDRWSFRAEGTTFSFNFQRVPLLAEGLILELHIPMLKHRFS